MDNLKDYWDLKSVIETYFKEGKEEGIAIGNVEGEHKKAMQVAKNALDKGLPLDMIAELTGLSKEEIEKLK